jgi:hypothetical protein
MRRPVFWDESATVSALEGKGPDSGEAGWKLTVVEANNPEAKAQMTSALFITFMSN